MTNGDVETAPSRPSLGERLGRVTVSVATAYGPMVGAVILVAGLYVLLARPADFRACAVFVQSHLPLTLPILMVIISIGVRVHELSTRQGWLGLCNYFSAGCVTFAIWALVSGENVKQFIWINDEKVLDRAYCVPLVITAFGLMAICSLVTALAENAVVGRSKSGWQVVQGGLVGLSLVALLAPYVLFEQKATVEARTGKSLQLQAFTVSIAFRDAALNQFLGRSSNPLQQSILYRNIAAKTADDAKEAALKAFNESDVSNQFVPAADRGHEHISRKVEVERAWVVAESSTSALAPGR